MLGTTNFTCTGTDYCSIVFREHCYYVFCSKLNDLWENGTTEPRRRLKDWLDPIGTNQTTLNGLDICYDVLVAGTRPPSGKTSERVVCKRITVQNATVPTGKTLELQATESVKIYSNFTVQSGAGFIIW